MTCAVYNRVSLTEIALTLSQTLKVIEVKIIL